MLPFHDCRHFWWSFQSLFFQLKSNKELLPPILSLFVNMHRLFKSSQYLVFTFESFQEKTFFLNFFSIEFKPSASGMPWYLIIFFRTIIMTSWSILYRNIFLHHGSWWGRKKNPLILGEILVFKSRWKWTWQLININTSLLVCITWISQQLLRL